MTNASNTAPAVYKLLRAKYDAAAARAAVDGPGWEHRDAVCDDAWNDLIDYVEENDLNYTALDPRGADDEQVAR